MSQKVRHLKQYQPLFALLDELGIKPTFTRTKHYKMEFDWHGEHHTVVIGMSPSDHRAGRNALARLRRILRS